MSARKHIKDIRSPLAIARDEWLVANRVKIERWAAEAGLSTTILIENRLSAAFIDGAIAEQALNRALALEHNAQMGACE